VPNEHHNDRTNARDSGGGAHVPARVRRPTGRNAIFLYDVGIAVLLVVIGVFYVRYRDALTWGGDTFKLAIEGMWFGSLGGVMISLKGIYDHADGQNGWDRSFTLWHIGRPLSGAIAGLMTVVLLLAVNSNGPPTKAVTYAVAFIFGTQERRFFNFLYEVARLVVQVPGESKTTTGPSIKDVQPAEGSAGDVVIITGQGFGPQTSAKLGNASIEKPAVSGNGASIAGIVPARPQGADTVDVVVSDETGAAFILPSAFKFKP
jgi:IPT/TIG domain